MQENLKRAIDIVEQLSELRKAKIEFTKANRKVFSVVNTMEEAEAELLSDLSAMGDSLMQDVPEAVKTMQVAEGFCFARRANPLYAEVGVFKYWREMLNAGATKPPAASKILELVKAGDLPYDALEFLPPDKDKTYSVLLKKPKDW